ncbi:MAG: exo-alpha-sialidase, partial [Anaerolineae bacterium]
QAGPTVPLQLDTTPLSGRQSDGLSVDPAALWVQLPPDERTKREFTIGNQGSASISYQLTIWPGLSPAGIVNWLTVSPTAGSLAPGAEALIDVRFDSSDKPLPGSDPDLYNADIRVDSDSLGEPRVLTVTAFMEIVSPTMVPVISPESLSSELLVGATAQHTLTLANEGNASMAFTVTVPASASLWLSTWPMTGTVPAEGGRVLTTKFDASGVSQGVHQADLTIATNSETTPALTVATMMTVTAPPSFRDPVDDSAELDTQPAIIRASPSGQLLVVFEREDAVNQGDLYLVTSADGGQTWTIPLPIINSSLDERHPALMQLEAGSFALFYAVEEEADGPHPYRIHRATSSDGLAWFDQGAIDLGWTNPGEVVPSVIRDEEGTLTMTYHRLGGSACGYLAQSTDGGVTWDTSKTEIVQAPEALPRVAKRESDARYLVTYQVDAGNGDLELYARTSTDPNQWDSSPKPVSVATNSHDGRPMVLEDGAFVVFYAQGPEGSADLYYRLSCDGWHWSDEVQVTIDPARDDAQPYALRHGIPGRAILAWAHQETSSTPDDYDVWVDNDIRLRASLCGAAKMVTPAVFSSALRLLTYTLSVPNLGLTTTVNLLDPLPADTAYKPASLWASSGRYGYDAVREAITWTGMVSTAAEITIRFQVTTTRVLNDAQSIANTVYLTDAEGLDYSLSVLAVADALPPASTIDHPVAGQYISQTTYVVDGKAVDAVSDVAEVAVSVDGGAWQPASGQWPWRYEWTGYADGEHNLRSMATDTLGHVETPGAGITVTVDTVAPLLVAHRPAAGAVDVPLAATVVLTFSEPILPASLQFSSEPAADAWSVSWNATGTVAHLVPSGFAAGRVYTFVLSSARDFAHNAVRASTWSYSTAPSLRYLPLVVANAP